MQQRRVVVEPLSILTGSPTTAWGWDDLDDPHPPLAGIPVSVPPPDTGRPSPVHPNGVTRVDHVVVRTTRFDDTLDGLVGAGLEVRRIREFDLGDAAARQGFLWVGETILEVVGPSVPGDGSPSTVLWGIAFETPDLDATVSAIGDACGAPRDAVQPGRRIATLRTRQLGISLAVSVMSPHGRDQPGAAQ